MTAKRTGDEDDRTVVKTAGARPARSGRGLWSSMRRLFTRPEAAAEDAPASGPMEGEEDHWVTLTLDELLKQQPDLDVHVVSLRQFRAAIGPTWQRVAPKVMLIADATLRRVAGPGNPVRQQGDELFLMAFPRLRPEDGHRRAATAAIELGKRLVGARFSIVGGGDVPALCLGSLKAGDLVDADGQLDPIALAAAGEATHPVDLGDAGPTAATGDDDTAQRATLRPLDRDEAAKGDHVWRRLEHRKQQVDMRLVPIEAPEKKKKSNEPEWVPIQKR